MIHCSMGIDVQDGFQVSAQPFLEDVIDVVGNMTLFQQDLLSFRQRHHNVFHTVFSNGRQAPVVRRFGLYNLGAPSRRIPVTISTPDVNRPIPP